MRDHPLVSVIIPAYWSADTLESCLVGLRDQTFGDFETIVVNSSPDGEAGQIAARFANVRFVQAPGRLLPHAARNHGAQFARGDLLVFTDPDTRARPDWLERLLLAFRCGHRVVVGGNEAGGTGWRERGIHLCKYSMLLSGLPPGSRWVAATSNALYGREVWEAVGPFDGSIFAGDALLSWRAARAENAPWFEPAAVVEHRHDGTLADLWRERRARGTEFAGTRTAFEGWSRWRAGAYLAALPLLVLLTLARTGRQSAACGWSRTFVATLPIQLVGQLAWCLGEARLHLRLLLSGRSARDPACASA